MNAVVAPQAPTPLEASADGRRNAHTMFCKPVGHSIHYATCLDRIAGGPSKDSMCDKNRGTSACKAHVMREEELAKGQAIYFTERRRHIGLAGMVEKAKALGVKIVTPDPAAPMGGVSATIIGIDEYSSLAAEAITEAAKQPGIKPLERPVIEPLPKPEKTIFQKAALDVRPGETMLEAAKRLLAAKQDSQN